MKKLNKLAGGLILVLLLFCMPDTAMAMVDTEGVIWRSDNPDVFINSVYQSALGRAPSPAEVARARRVTSKIKIFWEVVSKQEYKSMFPNLEVAYNIYVHSKWTRTPTGGLGRMCNCYYFSKSATDHCTAGPYTFPIARAVVLMTNAFDIDACPFFDCGFSTLGLDPDDPIIPARGNLVLDPNFASFGSRNGPWGRNVLYGKHGIWWNSNHAKSSAQKVTFPNNTTALYIKNQ